MWTQLAAKRGVLQVLQLAGNLLPGWEWRRRGIGDSSLCSHCLEHRPYSVRDHEAWTSACHRASPSADSCCSDCHCAARNCHCVVSNAAIGGHLDIIKWAALRGCTFCPTAAAHSVRHGHLRVLQWAHRTRRIRPSSEVLEAGAVSGSIELVQWLRGIGCPWAPAVAATAARHGHAQLLDWVLARRCPRTEWVCINAAFGGHIEALRVARAWGCPWDEETARGAAENGQLAALQWLAQQGCPWDARVCVAAAAGAHLEVLQWARDSGCNWDLNQHPLPWLPQGLANVVQEWIEANEWPLAEPVDDEDYEEFGDDWWPTYTDYIELFCCWADVDYDWRATDFPRPRAHTAVHKHRDHRRRRRQLLRRAARASAAAAAAGRAGRKLNVKLKLSGKCSRTSSGSSTRRRREARREARGWRDALEDFDLGTAC
ncbi:hypothetical protein JKP88DRAFT_195952 [Tribonema minus]|uniref:Ankyrin repeat protein n=1 Tax=Tribonema minus TaxID=303371 RepID=A0A835YTR4_9STRA|nr:hypothetical protein JKP88DRAFT_195952 [Tribonema minus]